MALLMHKGRGSLLMSKARDTSGGFMALRNNVQDAKIRLWKEVNPLQYFLVDIIIDKTIKWTAKEARIDIEHMVERTDQRRTHIYRALRVLKEKKIIVWKKDRDGSTFGLNEEYFGALLIKKHEESLQNRREKIKVVVDNSKERDHRGHSKRPPPSQVVTPVVTPSDNEGHTKAPHLSRNIEEKGVLKTFFKDTFKDILKDSASKPEKSCESTANEPRENGSEESYTPFPKREPKPKPKSRDPKLTRQWLEETKGENDFDTWMNQKAIPC